MSGLALVATTTLSPTVHNLLPFLFPACAAALGIAWLMLTKP